MIYQPNKIKEFFIKKDWNKLFQEILTILIGIGIGLYCYEQKVLWGPLKIFGGTGLGNILGGSGASETTSPYIKVGLIVICVSAFIKLLIYLNLFDANTLKGQRAKKRVGFDLNEILQEITTVVLGFTIGMFSDPIVKNEFFGLAQKAEYPEPTVGVILTLSCIFVKILLYSNSLNLNAIINPRKNKLWQPKKLKPFLGKSDWNDFFQELTSTFIGIGIGLYLFESKIILLPQKILPGVFGEFQEKTNTILKRVFGGTPLEKIDWVPPLWNNEAAKPYLMAGMIIIGISILIKLAIYTSAWDANSLKKFILGTGKSRSGNYKIDYNGIADETVTLILSVLIGLITTPIMQGEFTGERSQNPLFTYEIILFLFLAWIKFCLITEALRFSRN